MIVVRNSGFDFDMIVYAESMQYSTHNIYYLKEFIFWYALRYFYLIFNNEIVVFLMMDMIWIFLLYRTSINLSKRSLIKNNFSLGLIVILSTSFPLFFGYENIYRQLFATIFSLYSYSLLHTSYKKSILFFCISVFMHNISILLIPIFLINKIFRFKLYFRILLSLLVSIVFLMLFDYASKFKSPDSITGSDMSLIYLFLFLSIFIMYLIRFKFRFLDLYRKTPSLIIILILMSGLLLLKYNMISERLGMMFLVFLIFDLYMYSNTIRKYSNRLVFRLFLLLVFSVPILLFSSSKMFFI
jgi:hypothetical protein